ncbi:MAG: hypothetical protein JMN27_05165 [gamma proteobacterium endosymbiont of Lamellibrachia anaximandri]|nr:hypothetical protein [gamma proteobacterium endosymbiont of Lamellibrachia anaximandri]MBL3533206.1 hypothetical protein [gamma proteobacterium endosymbiont of Lamellibrachia anaximandri]
MKIEELEQFGRRFFIMTIIEDGLVDTVIKRIKHQGESNFSAEEHKLFYRIGEWLTNSEKGVEGVPDVFQEIWRNHGGEIIKKQTEIHEKLIENDSADSKSISETILSKGKHAVLKATEGSLDIKLFIAKAKMGKEVYESRDTMDEVPEEINRLIEKIDQIKESRQEDKKMVDQEASSQEDKWMVDQEASGQEPGEVNEMEKFNKVARISLMGGLIGAMTTNPRKALDDEIAKGNKGGWRAIQIIPYRTTNLFIAILQFLVLVITLGLFSWGGGYLVLFDREKS